MHQQSATRIYGNGGYDEAPHQPDAAIIVFFKKQVVEILGTAKKNQHHAAQNNPAKLFMKKVFGNKVNINQD